MVSRTPKGAVQKSPSSGSASSQGSGPAMSSKGVSRDYLRGASFADGAAALAPTGAVQMKYERGGGAAPVQMEASGGDPSLAGTEGAPVVPGATPETGAGGGGTPGPTAATPAPANSGEAERYNMKVAGDTTGSGTGRTGYKQVDGAWVPDPEAAKRGYVRGAGVGYGDRRDDLNQYKDPNDPTKGTERKNEKLDLGTVTGIPAPELDKLKSTSAKEVGGPGGTYAGYDVKSGGVTGSSTDITPGSYGTDKKDQKLLKGPNAYGQVGASARGYAGIKGGDEGKYGKIDGKLEAGAQAYAGASGKIAANERGVSASGAVGAGVEVKATADADYKTPSLKVGDADVNAGVGVHGEASASLKAGAGGGAYLTRDKIGVTGSIGAAAVAEAKANVHGNIGPVSGQYEVGVLAGAGIGAEGGIMYEDGKLTIGGRAYAALGYGVSTGGKVTIDLKASYQIAAAVLKKAKELGIKGAQAAYQAADADSDGKLTLNDPAKHAANAMDSGAKKLEQGVDSTIKTLDADGDGRFTRKDVGAHVDKGISTVKKAVGDTIDSGKKAVGDTIDRGKKALDVDGDGKLSMKDAGAAYDGAREKIGQMYEGAVDTAGKAKEEALAWGREKLADGKKLLEAAHKGLDRDGSGKLDLGDVKAGAKQAYDTAGEYGSKAVKGAKKAYEVGSEYGNKAIDATKAAVKSGAETVHKAADRDGDGKLGLGDVKAGIQQAKQAVSDRADALQKSVEEGVDAAKQKVEALAKRVHAAADLNKDGKVDAADAKIALQRKQAAIEHARRVAAEKLSSAKKAVVEGAKELKKEATQVLHDAHKTLDRTGDGKLGLDDVKQGASEAYQAAAARASSAKQAAVTYVKDTYKNVSEQASKAADTLSSGWSSATARAGAATDRAYNFFFGD